MGRCKQLACRTFTNAFWERSYVILSLDSGRRSSGSEHMDATHVWQIPQGGIDKNEDRYKAASRELYDETIIRSVEKLSEITEWLAYDIPRQIVGSAWGGVSFFGRENLAVATIGFVHGGVANRLRRRCLTGRKLGVLLS